MERIQTRKQPLGVLDTHNSHIIIKCMSQLFKDGNRQNMIEGSRLTINLGLRIDGENGEVADEKIERQ